MNVRTDPEAGTIRGRLVDEPCLGMTDGLGCAVDEIDGVGCS